MTEPAPAEGGQQAPADGSTPSGGGNPAAIGVACAQAADVARLRMESAMQSAGHRPGGAAPE